MTDRIIYTSRSILMVAESMFSNATRSDHQHDYLATITFCAFAIEGYLNEVGDRLFSDWEEHFDRLSPKEKLALISKEVDFSVDLSKEPFQSFHDIFFIRNQIAHPKTTTLKDGMASKNSIELPNGTKWAAMKWETSCNKKDVGKILSNTQKIIEALNENMPFKPVPNFLLSEHK